MAWIVDADGRMAPSRIRILTWRSRQYRNLHLIRPRKRRRGILSTKRSRKPKPNQQKNETFPRAIGLPNSLEIQLCRTGKPNRFIRCPFLRWWNKPHIQSSSLHPYRAVVITPQSRVVRKCSSHSSCSTTTRFKLHASFIGPHVQLVGAILRSLFNKIHIDAFGCVVRVKSNHSTRLNNRK